MAVARSEVDGENNKCVCQIVYLYATGPALPNVAREPRQLPHVLTSVFTSREVDERLDHAGREDG